MEILWLTFYICFIFGSLCEQTHTHIYTLYNTYIYTHIYNTYYRFIAYISSLSYLRFTAVLPVTL